MSEVDEASTAWAARDHIGRRIDIEFLSGHSEMPDVNAMCTNGMIWPPKLPPWVWTNTTIDVVKISHVGAWSSERCFAVASFRPVYLASGDCIEIGRSHSEGPAFYPLPLPR